MNAQEATVFLENKKELEKYKAMWEEFKKNYESYAVNAAMSNLEQKYFPQSVKKTITIEIEGEDGKLDWSINALKKYINNMIMDGMKVNIKEED
jgi:retron-type reverse transcriptase